MRLTAQTSIRGDAETVARLGLTPDLHARWDLRFSAIEPFPHRDPSAPLRFRYVTRIGCGLAVRGWGETVVRDGGASTALRFGSDDVKSLIREGAGSWRFARVPGGVRFATSYDYDVRWGRLGRALDAALFRPLMLWATRWSFDRLRLWVERGIAPEAASRVWVVKTAARTVLGLVWLVEGLVPKLLHPSAAEADVVRRSALWWGSPEATLVGLGIAEALLGIWLLTGLAERAATALATAAMLVLVALVTVNDPSAWADPYGGLVKSAGLVVCAIAVWALGPVAPNAANARGEGP